MGMLEGIRIQNFRVLRDVTLGKLWNTHTDPLSALTVVIGTNGSGKSSIFDAFGFLADCLSQGVEDACHARGRGGFDRLLSNGAQGSLAFELYYRETPSSRPITYELGIDKNERGRPTVIYERLRQRRKGQTHGRPFSFLNLEYGKGEAWAGQSVGKERSKKVPVDLTDIRQLGIATLGALREHVRITAFRNFLQGWYLSYFSPDAARSLPMAGPQKHLNVHGDNIGNVVEYLQREHADRFQRVLDSIADKIPGIERIYPDVTTDERLLLLFQSKGFSKPLLAQQMSDGTMKMLAYLLLLEDPEPPAFMCIEEPENGLYHKLLEPLAAAFRSHASGRADTQVFITTHQPYFVDALSPEETWILEKGEDGFSKIVRASSMKAVKEMVSQGIPLGSLWYSDHLDVE